MVPWKAGRSTIDFLLSEHKLETLVVDDAARSAAGLIERAERRLATARGGLAVGLPEFEKPTFERFRRARNSIQYFDPDAPEIDAADAEWAIRIAAGIVADVADLLDGDMIGPYRLS